MRNISKRKLSTRHFFFAFNFVLALLLCLGAGSKTALAQTTWSYATNSSVPSVSYSSNPLTAASDGNIYWSEQDGNGGAIYQIAPSGTATAIYSFNCTGSNQCEPVGAVLQGTDGFLYGVTNSGGANSNGGYFKVAIDGTGYTDLYDFNQATDGGGPVGGLTLGSDGNFYGVSNNPGFLGEARGIHRPASTRGTVSRTAGQHSASHQPEGAVSCGSNPSAIFFQLTPAGLFTPIFCANDDKLPATSTPLVQASDGNFYGISTDVSDSGGVVYQLTSAGGYTLLGSALPSGDSPFGALAGGPDGKFYAEVATSACGSALQFDPSNSYALVDFADLDCTDASTPYAWGLYLASDGAFYSAAPNSSGTYGVGGIFRIDMSGAVTYPYDFVPGSGQNPYTAPVQNSAGTFFGTTGSMGGASSNSGNAVIYTLTGSPALSAPVTLTSSTDETSVTLNWTVNNASPLTPPNCVALVNNSTGVAGWSGMVYGAFSGGVYSGSATVTEVRDTQATYQIVCPSQGAASISVFVSPLRVSRTALAIGPSSSMVTGTAATLTATVSRINNCGVVNRGDCAVHTDTPLYPTGTVTFSWNNKPIGQATLSQGVATFPVNTTNLAAQSYLITATYSGSDIFATSAATESGALTAIPTTTTLNVVDAGRTPNNANTITAGNNATFSAQVTASSGAAIPSGTVTFRSGSVSLGTATVDNSGLATFNVSSAGVPSGSYTVTAAYSGNRTHAAATSAAVNVVVAKASTITTLSASDSTINRNQLEEFIVNVSSNGVAPTGTVNVLWNNYLICSAKLIDSAIMCDGTAPSNAGFGPYSITAVYLGDKNNHSSVSTPTTVTVSAPI